MDLILCHTTADFDTFGAAVGAACLRPGSRIVLTGGTHSDVHNFLTLWRDEYPLIESRAVQFEQVRSITLVDAHSRDRFSPVNAWLDTAAQKHLPIYIYDHHGDSTEANSAIAGKHVFATEIISADFPTAEVHIDAIGAATTLLVEALQEQKILPTPAEATVMALGIHSDTGSLTFEQATARDAAALSWLMAQGANQTVVAEYHESGLSPKLQCLLRYSLDNVVIESVRGHRLAHLKLETDGFVPGLSGLVEHLISLLGVDTLLLQSNYISNKAPKAVVIGRSHPHPLLPGNINLQPAFEAIGGGGHAQAASAVLKGEPSEDFSDQENSLEVAFEEVLEAVRSQIPSPVAARNIMSSPVRTILPKTTVNKAQRILLRYGHAGLCVVDQAGKLSGIISRRDIDIALRHGLGHSPVKGYMSTQLKTISPQTSVLEAQALMTTYDIGRLPVLSNNQLIGIVTRSDLLRQLTPLQKPATTNGVVTNNALTGAAHRAGNQAQIPHLKPDQVPSSERLYAELKQRLVGIWPALMLIAEAADQQGWSLYVVGGAVRDLLLNVTTGKSYPLTDIDLVVDGAEEGAGVTLAETIQAYYPEVELQVHGRFQTATLIWHTSNRTQSALPLPSDTSENNSQALPLLIDIATARTEFYPYPAANPEVEASTIRQDLYRRDFTINAMALQLNSSGKGTLLDFFGGWQDLLRSQVQVLHANSFIEDPTRIFRAVRFALRLDFTINSQTEQFIRYAIDSGVYARVQASKTKIPALQSRLKAELKYLLRADRWEASLSLLDRLGALACIHKNLRISPQLWREIRRMDRWLRKLEYKLSNSTLNVPRWLMLLELLIAQLDASIRARVAENLNLGDGSIKRLQSLDKWEATLLQQLPTAKRPSEIYQYLRTHQTAELLLMGDRHPYTLGPKIWQYIVRLSQIPPLINGATLKRLGYRPGPQFKEILNAVHQRTLDEEITNAAQAERYVLDSYQLP